MNAPPVIFKKPPIVDVGISVQFANSLDVADNRFKFHSLVKQEFPLVVVPEQSNCLNDFGDYALYSENVADRLEIGMNYFRYVTTNYPGFPRFRTMFLSALSIFTKTYSLVSFSNFFFYYNNVLPVTTQTNFQDLFTLIMRMPGDLENKLTAGQGTLLAQEPEGHLSIEFKPEWKELQVAQYGFYLRFGSFKTLIWTDAIDELTPIVDAGHKHLEHYFFSLLQPQYIQFLEAQ